MALAAMLLAGSNAVCANRELVDPFTNITDHTKNGIGRGRI